MGHADQSLSKLIPQNTLFKCCFNLRKYRIHTTIQQVGFKGEKFC